MFIPAFLNHLSGKDIFKYTFMPAIGPRFRDLFETGFSNLALFMVLIYQAVKLIPADHAFAKPNAAGTYSIRDVLSEASRNLKFDLKHIDQVIIFFALIAGIIILCIQFLLLVTAFFVNPAQAQMPSDIGEFFTNSAPNDDIAYRMLDSVFGIPDLFGSQEITETAFHEALHGLFQFYSIGLLVIGALLVFYFIFAVLAETAQTGTPFGKRYTHAWVPIRLVVAFGLLIPISYGLNSGQWITLYSAKLGSNFATNGWNQFYQTLQDENTLGLDSPVAQPNFPELHDLAAFMTLAKACKAAYVDYNQSVGVGSYGTADVPTRTIRAWVIDPRNVRPPYQFNGNYESTASFSNNSSIHIRFGEKGTEYTEHIGNIYPFCGDLNIQIPEILKEASAVAYAWTPSLKINKAYYELVHLMWSTDFAGIDTAATEFMRGHLTHGTATPLRNNLKDDIFAEQRAFIGPKILAAIEQAVSEFQNGDEYLKYGWGGAGIFYNDIANINGRITNSVMNVPQIRKYPSSLEFVCDEVSQTVESSDPINCYDAKLSRNLRINFSQEETAVIAPALQEVHSYWYEDPEGDSGNTLENVINLMFGTQGLFDMCRNADVHPLAQLSTLGKGLVETAIRNIGLGIGLNIASILPVIGPTAGAIGGMALSFASIGILIGFILYYLIPFMPFLYFLFAVGGWVKGLFEAMVGVPLWALAHIRIDGQGLPGDAAVNGYFLIFEIFLRPILIVFGLIAAVMTFGAMIKVLNDIFGIVITNLSGGDTALTDSCFQNTGTDGSDAAIASNEGAVSNIRGPLDEFFYTIVYAILVYMIGMASFKLIDLIPNNILRWMGQGIKTFNDIAEEPAEGLIQKIAVGGSVLGGQIQSVAGGLGGGVKGLGGGVKDLVSPPKSG